MDRIEPDFAYFNRRSMEEAEAAEQASDQRARALHADLAERYAKAARASDAKPHGPAADEAPRDVAPLLSAEFRILN
jgi:hypothetical protein